MTNKLLPFNLEEALKDPNRVVYRNGEKPLEWHWFEKAERNSTLASINIFHDMCLHYNDGSMAFSPNDNDYDLLLLPLPERRYWVNVYGVLGHISIGRVVYNSEEEAKINASSSEYYLKSISFTI